MSKLLVDGDVLIYRAGFAVEKTEYMVELKDATTRSLFMKCVDAADAKKNMLPGSVTWSRKEVEPEDKALLLADLIIRDIQDRYPEHKLEIWLSPSVGNFREQIATRAKYKGNRDGAQRPTHFKAIRQHLIDKWAAQTTAGQEADDALGIEMTANPGSVCVSIDKDLLQIPGIHYDWTKKEEITISKKQGALNFWSQVLSGDATDNVPGLKGIGPAKAAKLLEKVKNDNEAWQVVLDNYYLVQKDTGFADALETAQLVYVRRTPNEMWSPPA